MSSSRGREVEESQEERAGVMEESSLLLSPHPDDVTRPQLLPALSSMQSVFMLCNSAIGAGVLSLPFAFQHAGVSFLPDQSAFAIKSA